MISYLYCSEETFFKDLSTLDMAIVRERVTPKDKWLPVILIIS